MKEVFGVINKMGMEGRDKSMLAKHYQNYPNYNNHPNIDNNRFGGKDPRQIHYIEQNAKNTVPVIRSVVYKESDDLNKNTPNWAQNNRNSPRSQFLFGNVPSQPFENQTKMTRSESSPVIARHTFNNNINDGSSFTDPADQIQNSPMRHTVSNNSIKSILKKTTTTSVEKTTTNNVVISTSTPQSRIVPRDDHTEDTQLVKAKIFNHDPVSMRNIPQRTVISPRYAMPRSVSADINKPFERPIEQNQERFSNKPPLFPKPKGEASPQNSTRPGNIFTTVIRGGNKVSPRAPQQQKTINQNTVKIQQSSTTTNYNKPTTSKSPQRSDSIFSPTYTKVLSDKEMSAREAWAETQKRKAKMREEFFKLPYQEVNWEIVNGRRSRSEPRRKTYTLPKAQINTYPEDDDIHLRYRTRDASPEISRSSMFNKSLPPSQRIGSALRIPKENTSNNNINEKISQERGRSLYRSSPIKQKPEPPKRTVPPKMHLKNPEQIYNQSRQAPTNYTTVPPNNINENHKQKTGTNANEKSNSVEIHMRNGPSFANHQLNLKSIVNPNGGTVTVRRYKVPQIPFQEKMDWISRYAPEALGPLREQYEQQYSNMSQPLQYTKLSPSELSPPPISPKSPTSPMELTTPSPTPSLAGSCCMSSASSSSSSGCYSGSCSPTPPPSRLLKAGVPPTHL